MHVISQVSILHFLSLCWYLHLILPIPSDRLLTGFDNELAKKSYTISKLKNVRNIFCNFFFIFISSCNFFFYWNCKWYVFFNVFCLFFKLFFNFFCYLFYNKMMVIIRSIMKSYRTFFSHKIYKLHMLCAAPI